MHRSCTECDLLRKSCIIILKAAYVCLLSSSCVLCCRRLHILYNLWATVTLCDEPTSLFDCMTLGLGLYIYEWIIMWAANRGLLIMLSTRVKALIELALQHTPYVICFGSAKQFPRELLIIEYYTNGVFVTLGNFKYFYWDFDYLKWYKYVGKCKKKEWV